MENLWQEYREKGLQMVGVWAYQKTHLDPILAQTGVSFPIGIPTDSTAMKVYTAVHSGTSWFPFQVLIDGNGKVVYMASDYDAEGLRGALEKALSSKSKEER